MPKTRVISDGNCTAAVQYNIQDDDRVETLLQQINRAVLIQRDIHDVVVPL